MHSKNISFLLRNHAQINFYHVHLPKDVLKQIIAKSSHPKWPECSWLSANINEAWQVYGVSTITDLPRQMVPLPTYPGLQVQLCPLMVLVQIAFSSQLCCPLPHSSCSKWGGGKGKKRFTRSSELFSELMWHLKSKWDNQNVAMAACWGPGMGVSYGLASVQKPNICMATVDYLDSKTEKKNWWGGKLWLWQKAMEKIIREKYLLWRLTFTPLSIPNSK